MTSEYIDLITAKRYSYSSLTTFEQCRKQFFLTYLNGDVERVSNYFSEYGTNVHELLEMYFRNYYEATELADAYLKRYDSVVKSPPPFFVKPKKYFSEGYEFFSYFDFNKDDYEIIMIEDRVGVDLSDYKLIVKPDWVGREKKTGKVILMDYKTSLIDKGDGKIDSKKLGGYKKQMLMYSLYLKTKDIFIDEVYLWFIRQKDSPFTKFKVVEKDEKKVEKWIADTINEIRKEDEFPASIDTNPTDAEFFCENLCGVKSSCLPFLAYNNKP